MCVRFASLLLVLAVACNTRLGLDPVAVDDDRDGLLDTADNCPTIVNIDQEDWDANGVGDACDECATPSGVDEDGDGIDDACDGCVGPGRTGELGADGIDNGCEECPTAVGHDVDEDGIDDACDVCNRGPNHDEDGDGIFDACDNCPSRSNPTQAQTDLDGDRLGDECDPDSDPLDTTIVSLTERGQGTRMFEPFDGTGDRWEQPPPGVAPWNMSGDRGVGVMDIGYTSRLEVGYSNLIETVVDFSGAPAQASVAITLNWTENPCAGPCQIISSACSVARDGTVTLNAYTGNVVTVTGVDTSSKVKLWYRSRYDKMYGGGGVVQLCVAVGANGVTVRAIQGAQLLPASQNIAFDVSLTSTNAPLPFDYAWFVAN